MKYSRTIEFFPDLNQRLQVGQWVSMGAHRGQYLGYKTETKNGHSFAKPVIRWQVAGTKFNKSSARRNAELRASVKQARA